MKQRGPVVPLVAAMLAALVLATALADGAWVLWPPVLLALAVVGRVWCSLTR